MGLGCVCGLWLADDLVCLGWGFVGKWSGDSGVC